MCVEPIPVLEERAKQRRNLPLVISLGAWGERAGRAQKVAPMLKKLRLAIAAVVYRPHASNGRHGSHLFGLSVTE
jgi:hypothetical protein